MSTSTCQWGQRGVKNNTNQLGWGFQGICLKSIGLEIVVNYSFSCENRKRWIFNNCHLALKNRWSLYDNAILIPVAVVPLPLTLSTRDHFSSEFMWFLQDSQISGINLPFYFLLNLIFLLRFRTDTIVLPQCLQISTHHDDQSNTIVLLL
jgi:hypothetical protein